MLIEPPKTKRNISTKMIGWIVEKTSSCGTRRYCRRLRLITATVSRTRLIGMRRSATSCPTTTWAVLMPSLPSGP